ncbi:Mycobacterium terramassiliense ORFan [Mycobacterium terramassiliense]|uniref:Mycobacterium terramassiliense ORFan n=2 Tax=Mycobacterium terramassiliense TaxID=1841859 RepID=A0A2U3NKS4_9MYCO|nr:Mycobacterium terramassiliense ORFan [Mycobacterium terramassiliense]
MRYADRILNRIERLNARKFGVYACKEYDGSDRICLVADFKDRESFMLPMTLEAAHEMAIDMLSAVMAIKPEMLFGSEIAAQYKSGQLSLHELKQVV